MSGRSAAREHLLEERELAANACVAQSLARGIHELGRFITHCIVIEAGARGLLMKVPVRPVCTPGQLVVVREAYAPDKVEQLAEEPVVVDHVEGLELDPQVL